MTSQKDINFYTASAMMNLGTKIFNSYFATSLESIRLLDNYCGFSYDEYNANQNRKKAILNYIFKNPECCYIVVKDYSNMSDYVPEGRRELLDAIWYDRYKATDRVVFVSGSLEQIIRANTYFGEDSVKLQL